jgi:hypothetical protein
MEEAQHAQLDTLMVEAIAETCDTRQVEQAIDGYLEIGAMFDGALRQQAAFDLDALQRATRQRYAPAEAERIVAVQHQAMRWTFLGSGISHPSFLRSVEALSPARAVRLAEVAKAFY